jgi:hypothetical protein
MWEWWAVLVYAALWGLLLAYLFLDDRSEHQKSSRTTETQALLKPKPPSSSRDNNEPASDSVSRSGR